MTYADNALMAKARAVYGKRLRSEDYQYLIEASSLPELVNYLKNETYYSDALREVRGELVHRGQLEYLLRKEVLNICLRLLRYTQEENLFLRVYALQNEQRLLLSAINMLQSGEKTSFIQELPLEQQAYTRLPLTALAEAKSYAELLEALHHTPYFSVLTECFAKQESAVFIPLCEHRLLQYYYSTILESIKEEYKGKTRRELLAVFTAEIDTYNILTIYRLKRYFSFAPEEIQTLLLTVPTSTSQRKREEYALANSPEQLLRELKAQKPMFFSRYDFSETMGSEELIIRMNQVKFDQARKLFRFSTAPVVVAISYLTLLEIEIANIFHIIEGTRYQVPSTEIKPMLAYE